MMVFFNSSEMEFLDINLTKDSSHLLHAIQDNQTLLGFKKYTQKKSVKQENSSLFVNSIL